jgi:predicted metal-dependent peptidase
MARQAAGSAIQRCVRAVLRHAHAYPHLLLVHALLRSRYLEDGEVATLELNVDGTLRVNPAFVFRTEPGVLAGVIFHTMLHVVLDHARRRGHRPEEPWWLAADMVINAALQADRIDLPGRAVLPPNEYEGPLQVEPLADYLATESDEAPSAARKHRPLTAGCGVPEGWADAGLGEEGRRALAEAMGEAFGLARSMGAGTGTSAVLDLMAPQPPRLDWKTILRHGVSLARATTHRDRQSFTRPDRRQQLDDGIILPGWRSEEIRLAVVVDVSGSMARDWVARIVAEVGAIARSLPGARLWLATHTDKVCWSGWITTGGLPGDLVTRAFGWTGGTDPDPVYRSAGQAGRFDALVHFTDGQFPSESWPVPPRGARLVVGAFGDPDAGALGTVPPGTTVIPCTHPRDDLAG